MPKISVCIPVYGVEKYIERCARSLFEQTMTDGIEFIFVNDCTKDKSIEILEQVLSEYPQRKNQVKIIHHEKNGGLVAARNTGLKHAAGDYIIHCDSDDWVDINMYETMYNKAIETNADVVCCPYIVEKGNNHFKIVVPQISPDIDTYIKNNFGKHLNSLWSKLYKKEIALDKTLYVPDHICMAEDLLRNSQMLVKCQRIAYVENTRYHYRANDESITHTLKKKHIDNLWETICLLKDYLPENFSYLTNRLYRSLLLTTLIEASKKTETEEVCKDIWLQAPLSIKLGIILDQAFSWKSKLIVFAACMNRKFAIKILLYFQ